MSTDILLGSAYDSGGPRGSDRWMEANQSSARFFEKSKIKVLQDEREAVQKKTFTKWVNSHLQRVNARVNDLYSDLRDGRKLILLLEILSGEKLPRPSKGRMRIHMLENADHALQFLKQQKVHLENIGSHDIVDGNPKITLGLIWTIILRFQIQDIMIEMETTEKKSAKEALLLWCQSKTVGYRNVTVTNFTKSWRDGLAFCAIIHKQRPDLIDYDKLTKEEPVKNLNLAFETAERELGVVSLLDAPDVNVDYPDEKSIMTYVSTLYGNFAKMKQVEVSGTRIQKVVKQAVENEGYIQEYEMLSSTLLRWIRETVLKLSGRDFGNTFPALQQQMAEFNVYRTQEKPPKFVEKGNLEVKIFELTSNLRLNHQKMYNPPEGIMINDINKAWQEIEKAEHDREVAIRAELIRQERLDQLVSRFFRKAMLRQSWLVDNQKLLSQDNFGFDLPAVEASVKKHEAIETDITAYEERIVAVQALATEIEQQRYHDIDTVTAKNTNVVTLWHQLLRLLSGRSIRLQQHLQLHKIFQEKIYIINWMEEVKIGLLSEDYGKHFLGVEDLLQKHNLVEADIQAQAERVKNTNTAADPFLQMEPTDDGYKPDVDQIRNNQKELESSYEELCSLAEKRKKRLEESLQLHSFYRDVDEEEIWLSEKEYFVSSTEYGRDVPSTMLLLKKHEAVESELAAKKTQTDILLKRGEELKESMPYAAPKIEELTDMLLEKWRTVEDLAAQRRKRLEEMLHLHQYFSDCNEVSVSLDELEAATSIDDLGHDEDSVEELLKKHRILTDEIESFGKVIDGLEEQRVQSLGDEDKENPDVLAEKQRIDQQYEALKLKGIERQKKLLEALALYQLYSEAELVKSWITERHVQLETYLNVEKTYDLEQCQVIETRFEGFEQELIANQERLNTVNRLASELAHKEGANGEEVQNKVQDLNNGWVELNQQAEQKKIELRHALTIQTLYSVIVETQTWIVEKSRILTTVEEVGTDLSSVIILQRRLNSIERDIAALQKKLQVLRTQAKDLSLEHPEEAGEIQGKTCDLMTCWDDLCNMVKQRNDSLAESGELKRFIIDLDDFHDWLQRKQQVCASEDIAQSLQEAEAMLDGHNEVKAIIDQHQDDYNRLTEEGPKHLQDEDDLQTQNVKQELDDVIAGWRELQILWERRRELLEANMNYQIFLRDAKQAEALLGHQELFLSIEENPPTVDTVLLAIRKYEDFCQKLDQHDEKINHVMNLAIQLSDHSHYATDKIKDKAKSIDERRNANRGNANLILEKLREQLRLKQFLQEADDMADWMKDRLHVSSEISSQELTNIKSKLRRQTVFEAERHANKDKIETINQDGQQLIADNPENIPEVEERLNTLEALWAELDTAAGSKTEILTEANREEEFKSEVTNLDNYIKEVETTLVESETGTDLSTVKAQFTRHKIVEKEITEKRTRMIQLCSVPGDQVDGEKRAEEQRIVEERFEALEAPLEERRANLEETFDFYQFQRDIQDEHLWIEDKEPILTSQNFGNKLEEVQRLKKRHRNRCIEIDGHEPLVNAVCQRGEEMVDHGHPKAEEIIPLKDNLLKRWDELKVLSKGYEQKLDESLLARQYFYDALEAESWMSEQELYMIGDDRGKDENSVQALIKKQQNVQKTITDFEETIQILGTRAKVLEEEGHPERANIETTQNELEKTYARLRDLAIERQGKLDESLKLYQLNREIEDLEAWIAEREAVASSQDIGQDFDHVQMLEERFNRFADETQRVGSERVENVNAIADQLIGTGHSDAAIIAEWKDGLNESWANLLELIETRRQMLSAAHEYHRYFQEAKETLAMIQEKDKQLADDLGRDQQSVYALQRQHRAFEADLLPLGTQVQGIQDFANKLKTGYAGDKAQEIDNKEEQVVQAWENLLNRVKSRTGKLGESDELQRFLLQIEDLLLWIRNMRQQIATDEKPRNIPTCQGIMDNHKGRKAEMDAKEEKFTITFMIGEQMIERNHYSSDKIQYKLDTLKEEKNLLEADWDCHWEELTLTLEVMLFARDAHLADEWMAKNEGTMTGKDAGQTMDEIEKMIEKHSGFEKLLSTQEERFLALENLTTFELRSARRRQMENAKREKEERERLEREELERQQAELELLRVMEEQRRRAEEEKENEVVLNGEMPSEPKISREAELALEELMKEADEQPEESEITVSFTESVEAEPGQGPSQEAAPSLGNVKMSGILQRKHTLEGSNKKASQRSWRQYFVILREHELLFYRDENDVKGGLEPLQIFSTEDSRCEVASNYHKKKNVFRLRRHAGGEYLLQARDADELSLWIQHIRGSAINNQHLPEQLEEASPPKKEKKSRLFSMKKK